MFSSTWAVFLLWFKDLLNPALVSFATDRHTVKSKLHSDKWVSARQSASAPTRLPSCYSQCWSSRRAWKRASSSGSSCSSLLAQTTWRTNLGTCTQYAAISRAQQEERGEVTQWESATASPSFTHQKQRSRLLNSHYITLPRPPPLHTSVDRLARSSILPQTRTQAAPFP